MEEAPGRIDALVFEGHLQVTGFLASHYSTLLQEECAKAIPIPWACWSGSHRLSSWRRCTTSTSEAQVLSGLTLTTLLVI